MGSSVYFELDGRSMIDPNKWVYLDGGRRTTQVMRDSLGRSQPWDQSMPFRQLVGFLAIAMLSRGSLVAQQRPNSTATQFDFTSHIGVVGTAHGDGPCLAIYNPSLPIGTTVFVVWVPVGGQPDTKDVSLAQIAQKTKGSCERDSSFQFVDSGDSLYQLKVHRQELNPNAFYFGILATADRVDVDGDFAIIDLDADGRPETFRVCTSNEGVHLTVWTGLEPNEHRVWHRYLYLGYDTEPNCTPAEYQESN